MLSKETAAQSSTVMPPGYFSRIKESAARRWNQLEADPELAGPWHQLFKQVQSPRHILSELLQNADDAGADEASVSISNDRFVFEHNGEDFTEVHFASICRFGYSNKRALHTIGFRGIGFKSTFSLGDRVELYSPSLAVAFERDRFTEPHWLEAGTTLGETRVEVNIADSLLSRELEKNLNEWMKSPVSLLFFRNIRRLQIDDRVVHWQSLGPGPVANSEWMSLDEKLDDAFLLMRSKEEPFPLDALDEIRKERMLGAEDSGDFPPCRVEIVLGAPGRLYVVLPTGVETPLPFACNAPFIQDPARLKIKDPETSPTNRWLLKRAGELAASAMVKWLEQTKTGALDRAAAYGLLPDVDRDDNSLEGSCAAIVEVAFADELNEQPILLTDEGKLVSGNAAIIIPQTIFEIWPAEQAIALLDEKSRPALCRHVSHADRAKLIHWQMIEAYSKSDLLDRLRLSHLPRPSTWRHLLNLWSYIAPEVTGWQCHDADHLRIVPVQGKEVLYSASEIVRLGEKRLLQSDDDWEFLAGHLIVLNQNWTRFLAEQRRGTSDQIGKEGDAVEAAFAVLEEIGLDETSNVSALLERVATDFFNSGEIKLASCIQIAQIAAKLGASVGDAFRFTCADRTLRPVTDVILFDENGALEDLLPEKVQQTQLLHPDYTASFISCSREDWLRWVSSGQSGLQTFAPLTKTRNNIYGRQKLTSEAEKRGLSGSLSYPYVTNQFVVEDWDFPIEYWRHWETLSKSDPNIWAKVAGRVLEQRDTYWSRSSSARLSQVATTGSTRSLTSEPLRADWLLKLGTKPCLPDTRDMIQVPSDLLRRTPQTESLIDVEAFVHGLLDRETNRPLLDRLGVRSTPTGPDRLLGRLRALAGSEKAPAHEAEKWYRRLDQMLDEASTSDAHIITDAFKTEKLILTHDGGWVTSDGVFLLGEEEDAPGAAIVRASVLDLSLWRRVGVAERPSADLALQWLGTLNSGSVLEADDARRVRKLMSRYPNRIWEECGHWVNLSGEWIDTGALTYGLGMQTLFTYNHLHDWVKRKTADLRQLLAATVENAPFNGLRPLSGIVEERLNENLPLNGKHERHDWLTSFGSMLSRIELNDPDETERVRMIAEQMERTVLIGSPKLEVIPYIDGVPAGTSRLADILWLENTLYVGPLNKAKLAKRLPEEIGKSLNAEVRAALAYAFERSPTDIKAYLEENFTLGDECEFADTREKEAVNEADTSNPSDGPDPGDSSLTVEARENSIDVLDDDELSERHHQDEEAEDEDISNDDSRIDLFEPSTDRPPRAPTKPARPKLINRFAAELGYRADGQDRFFKDDGSWIARTSGARFPWERRAANGGVIRYYYPREHCLDSDPLQIEADIWSLLDQKPDLYAFILTTLDDKPIEVTGAELRTLRDDGNLTIHPATYRLVKPEASA